MNRIAYLYSLARRDNDSEHFHDLVTGVTREQLVARLKQDGVGRQAAECWVEHGAIDAERSLELDERVTAYDISDYGDAGPRNESYRIVTVAVRCVSAAATTH